MNTARDALAWLRERNPELAAIAERAMAPSKGEYHRAAVSRLLFELRARIEERKRAQPH